MTSAPVAVQKPAKRELVPFFAEGDPAGQVGGGSPPNPRHNNNNGQGNSGITPGNTVSSQIGHVSWCNGC